MLSSDVNPVLKKKNPFDKIDYRPVSVLPTISKIFEKIIENQLNHYIHNHLSTSFCGYQCNGKLRLQEIRTLKS